METLELRLEKTFVGAVNDRQRLADGGQSRRKLLDDETGVGQQRHVVRQQDLRAGCPCFLDAQLYRGDGARVTVARGPGPAVENVALCQPIGESLLLAEGSKRRRVLLHRGRLVSKRPDYGGIQQRERHAEWMGELARPGERFLPERHRPVRMPDQPRHE